MRNVIEINNIKRKPDLNSLFNDFLKKESKKEKQVEDILTKYLLSGMLHPSDEDDFDYDYGYGKSKKAWKKQRKYLEGFSVKDFSVKEKKKNSKRGKRGEKKTKYKQKEIFTSSDALYDAQMNDKTIYFYKDINRPENCMIFYTLYDFDEFLNEEGIDVSEKDVNALMHRETSHCCVNPDIKATNGEVQLITDSSYGGLYWECHGDEEDIYSDSRTF